MNRSREEELLNDQVIALSQNYDDAIELLRMLYHGGNLDEEETELVENLFDDQDQTL